MWFPYHRRVLEGLSNFKNLQLIHSLFIRNRLPLNEQASSPSGKYNGAKNCIRFVTGQVRDL